MKTAMGDDMAVKFHAPMAKELGATKPEIVDAMRMRLNILPAAEAPAEF